MQKLLPKNKLNKFLEKLTQKYEVIAPVKEENTKFKIIQNPEEVYLDFLTEVPAKQFFLPEGETLVDFKKTKTQNKKRVIFGLRKCDLNAIKILDKVMLDEAYRKKRKNTILIGLFCEKIDEKCFCESMELEDFYDLFFYPDGKDYYISIGSKRGKQLVKNLPNTKKQVIKQYRNIKKLKNKNIEKHYNNKIWKTNSEKCLSCSACTVYCPTCNCFDIKDKSDININPVSRTRSQTSCQLQSFSKVAGGKVFREKRLARFKHFVYHKISYFKKQTGKYMCVGCGRCLRVCPTKIDWTNTINILK